MHSAETEFDAVCDVLVVGSGAAGLSTAITAHVHGLDVLVVEKEKRFGGTTARSGGWLWVPGNALAQQEGVSDTQEDAERYIKYQAGQHFDEERVKVFLANAGPMIEFFCSKTDVDFNFGTNYPDYHPDHPGAVEQGRSIHPVPYDGRKLGKMLDRLAMPMKESTFMGMGLNSGPDLKHFLNATRSVPSAIFVAKRMFFHFLDVMRYGRGTRLVNGTALAARLFQSALIRGIPLWESAPATKLLVDQGRVVGALVRRDGKSVKVLARQAVVLAAGGFPHDQARRSKYFRHLLTSEATMHTSLAPEGNVGDGLNLAEQLGAGMVDSLTNEAPWAPVSLVRYANGTTGKFFHLIDRAKPGMIAVTNKAKRFVNESENYHDFVREMIDACSEDEEVSAFLICDHRAIRRYGMGAVRPSPLPLRPYLKMGYLLKGNSIEELAQKMDVDPVVLTRTVSRFNADAAQGVDQEFGKGSTSYQRLLGDTDFSPNPCLAPLQRAPFYAVKMVPGDLGTYVGLSTDVFTRVLSNDGQAIPGLHAVGNDAATVFGGSYPGAGATLGPAMTFGFICGRYLAGEQPPE